MCKKAKSRLAFELRCKDRKEIKFCRLPLLGVHGVSRGSQQSLQLHSFQEYKVHFTVVRSLQDSPQAHSSSVFLFQGIKDLLENVTGWAKKGGAELAIPVCELHFPPGIPVPQTKLLLQETAKCTGAANFQLEQLKTLHEAGQFDPTIPHSLELSLLSRWICLPGCISVTGRMNTNAECNLVAVVAKEKEKKTLSYAKY